MIKTALLLLAIIISANSATFKDFTEARDACFWAKLGNVFTPINTQGIPLSDD